VKHAGSGRASPDLGQVGPVGPVGSPASPGRGPKRYGASAVRLGRDLRPSAVVLVRCCMRARRAVRARVSREGAHRGLSRSGEGWNRSRRGRGRQVQVQNLHAGARVGSRALPACRRLRQWHRRLRFSCTKSRAGEI
jgi:hypothetical protein